jgi:Heterokaryon incompatibility protein (HET)
MNEILGSHLNSPVTRAQESTFAYNALGQPEHNIRAVRLHPRRWRTDPMIICDIVILDLNTEPWYEALSYEWGSPSTSMRYTIRLDNKSIVVRKNLWWALYQLRDAHQTRTLWIDAICINQSDVHERNCQVSRMGDIYSQAARVVAWIGQANFEGGHAIWQTLRSFCSRSYWSRLWIVQEVLLASELYIQCGSLSFQWEELSNVFHYLKQVSTVSCPLLIKLSVVSSVPFRLNMLRKEHQMAVLAKNNNDLLPLLDLVDLFKDASCFDDRDKIFGLRSLSLPCCKDAVKTNYSMDREGVINTLLAHHEAQHT